ncbi:XRE family transcriptional regulator [Listeria monocytogenes]|nr:XRE family transcriptional regulator [Listeria monocytogenes]
MGKQVYDYTSLLTNFSLNMKSVRIKKKLTQKKLASLVGVSKQTILNYENQKTIPTSSVMESISLALEVPLDQLIGEDTENQKRMKLAEKIEEMDTNPYYQRLEQEEFLLSTIYELAELKIKDRTDQLTEDYLDSLIGAPLAKTFEEKKKFVFKAKEIDIQEATNQLADRYFTLLKDTYNVDDK